MSGNQLLTPPPAEEEVAAAATAGTGPAWQQSQALTQATEDAMALLTQGRVDTFAHTDSDEDKAGADDMTREFMGSEYTENVTLSGADFDQWMSNHAELDEELEYYPGFEHEQEELPADDVQDKWLADRMAWNLQDIAQPELAAAGGFGTEHDPITIGSSDVEEDHAENGYDGGDYGEGECYEEECEDGDYEMGECLRQPLSSSQYLQLASPNTPGIDQMASVASAMLALNREHGSSVSESMTVTEPVSPPHSAYQRPPLPPTHASKPSLLEMHMAISQSIDRSLSIVDEISTSCDAAWANESYTGPTTPADSANGQSDEEGVVRAIELETHDSVEPADQAVDRLYELQADSAIKQTALNTQIFKLSAELNQTASEKSELESSVTRLERENSEYSQTIDDLQQQMEALRSTSSEEIEGLKERVRCVASKISLVTSELAETSGKLDETKQVLTIVSSERTDLLGKCRGLETTVESLLLRLDGELKQHDQTKQALHVATDGNANENRRAALEAANRGLEQRCKDLVDEVGQSKKRERLLLNSNRALEARLSDLLRKLDESTKAEDVLAEHRCHWDLQLVESRKEAADLRKRLTCIESDLTNERRDHELLKVRLREDGERGDQSVKKRRHEDAGDDFVLVTPVRGLKSNICDTVTPSRPPVGDDGSTNVARGAMSGVEYIYREQTLVDSGEQARGCWFKSDPRTPIRVTNPQSIRRLADGPVTPRIGLTPQSQQPSLSAMRRTPATKHNYR
ncbi:hypothetical protein IWW37_004615 [Coemansia sp. RSA 2050]|nr:hypothetical protein IWW37_004615 [Coemansia sp. RSA 2050]KAJ2731181.1 hypothetical protein IW152_004729 [Coemansia sp. BCRC 34962]